MKKTQATQLRQGWRKDRAKDSVREMTMDEERLVKKETGIISQVELDEIVMLLRTEERGWGRLPTEEEYYKKGDE